MLLVLGTGVDLACQHFAFAQVSATQDKSPANPPVPNQHALSPQMTPAKTLYRCPMHSHIVQDHPGTCPICGMDLVRVTSGGEGIVLDAATVQRLGVQLAQAKMRKLVRPVHTYGTVAVDTSRVEQVSAVFDGLIKSVKVKAVGDRVRAGDVLYEIYSPDLIAQQRDYLKLLERQSQLRKLLPDPGATENEMVMNLTQERMRARARFAYQGLDGDTLRELESRNQPVDVVPIRAQKAGVVLDLPVRAGSAVSAMSTIVSLADLSQVWIDIALYEDQLAWVKEGDEVTGNVANVEQQSVNGRLKIIGPVVDSNTRTVRARIAMNNTKQRMLPGQYVDITIHSQSRSGLALPKSALLRTGTGTFVMQHRGAGRFVPAAVTTGIESSLWVEILQGLSQGDEVAVNGQFLLAAEASMQDTLTRSLSAPVVDDNDKEIKEHAHAK